MTSLLTRRDDLATIHWHDQPVAAPAAGQVLAAVEHVALTSNVFTYGAAGESLRYWDYWPIGLPEWGCLPAWGVARVVASDLPDLPVGSRFAGLLPIASHAVLQPDRITETSFRDVIEHKRDLMAAYQHYIRLTTEPDPAQRRDEQLASVLRPLVVLAALLADDLQDSESVPKSVVITSASSRTARALALELRGGPRLIGLTSIDRAQDVDATGLYDEVLHYNQAVTAPPPTVVVDFAGRTDIRRRAAAATKARTIAIGTTHGNGDSLIPGRGEATFLAPDHIQLRGRTWGRERVEQFLETAWQRHLDIARTETVLEQAITPTDIDAAYHRVRAGHGDMHTAHLLTIPTPRN